MQTAIYRFNIYYLYGLITGLVLLVGCKSPEQRRVDDMIGGMRLHIASGIRQRQTQEPVIIAGVSIYTDKQFFADERSLTGCQVYDSEGGGFTMRFDFNLHGKLALEAATADNPEKQIAIFIQYGEKKLDKASWVAAPRIRKRMSEGVLEFSPAVDRQSAEDMALALSNTIKEQEKPLANW